jgi:hypothetical protein
MSPVADQMNVNIMGKSSLLLQPFSFNAKNLETAKVDSLVPSSHSRRMGIDKVMGTIFTQSILKSWKIINGGREEMDIGLTYPIKCGK